MEQQMEELQDLEQEPAELVPGASSSPTAANGRGSSRKPLLIIIIAILVIILAIALANHKQPVKKTTTITINTQSLSAGTLQKLEANAGPGPTTERLVITPNTLFKNGVEVQGGTLLDNGLAITGILNLTGNLNVSGSITGASLSVGSLTISNIQLNDDLNFGGHLNPDGSSPTAKSDVATSGGTVTIAGSDTAGTITIKVGNGQLIAGELAVISFHRAFAITPRVELTPANDKAAGLNYFVTQSPSFFSVETATKPANNTTYIYNYFATQ